MKCIRCHADSKYKDRRDGHCPVCRRAFAFEPRTGDPITDAGFKSAIDAVSSMETVRFLPDHVYYEVARRRRSKGHGRNALYGLGALGLVVAVLNPVVGLAIAGAAGGAGTLLWPRAHARFSRAKFDEMWQRWISAHGAPAGLIVRSRHAPTGPYRGHTDIPSYSFDRAVVCDRAATVDVLLANNFHFENNCAVLSVDGYPPHAFDLVRQMLANNPRLVVYALHDASHAGCSLAHRLASDRTWFRGRARVVEVGLRPAHAKALRGVWQAPDPAPDERPGTTAAERAWLDRNALELAAIRPEQVIKRLYATIVADAALEPASNHVATEVGAEYYVDSTSFHSDAGASDGGPDGFG
jgi:hypothetical protein